VSALALMRDLQAAGAVLEARGDRLHVDAPVGLLTRALRTAILEHKAALLVLLSGERSAPAADAPAHVWAAYFDRQIELINQDLAAEGSTFEKALAAMRPKRRRRSQEELREAAFARAYRAEFVPGRDTPAGPCACGDRVFYRTYGDAAWRCRTCQPIDARWRVRWVVTGDEWGR
jgi:hypothetical protein